jgi:hypothetical protein
MTEPATVPAPQLVHSGTYALYETPDGGRHLVYRQTVAADDAGGLHEVAGEDAHLPDIPPAALPLIDSFLTNGFPPAVLALLNGKLNPATVLKAMRGANGAS